MDTLRSPRDMSTVIPTFAPVIPRNFLPSHADGTGRTPPVHRIHSTDDDDYLFIRRESTDLLHCPPGGRSIGNRLLTRPLIGTTWPPAMPHVRFPDTLTPSRYGG